MPELVKRAITAWIHKHNESRELTNSAFQGGVQRKSNNYWALAQKGSEKDEA